MNNDKRFSGVLGGGEYDLLKKALYYYDTLEETIADNVVKNIENKSEAKLLEIGIGSGITTAFVLDKIKNLDSVTVFAIDNEEKMLEEARSRFTEIKNIEFINDDIFNYLRSIPDSFFDVCYSGYVIHNFNPEMRKELFKELSRVMKTGALFVNGDKIVVDDVELQKELYEREVSTFDEFEKIERPDIKKEWTIHYEQDELIRFTEKEQGDLLKENNFGDCRVVFRELMGCVFVATKK